MVKLKSLLFLLVASSARRRSNKDSFEESSEEKSSEEKSSEEEELSSGGGTEARECRMGRGERRILLDDSSITEASGLAGSGTSPGLLWTVTDKGGPAKVFGLKEGIGRVVDVTVEGAENNDWEDIARDTVAGQSFLYVADTGSNKRKRRKLHIYKFPEPQISGKVGEEILVKKENVVDIQVTYPGNLFDCEALAIDPQTKDLLLFTKDRKNSVSQVFTATEEGGQLKYVTTLPHFWVTGADISSNSLVLTNKEEGWRYKKSENTTWIEFLASNAKNYCTLRLQDEEQRESIAIFDGGLWTTSECKDDPPCPLWFYQIDF